MTFKLLPPGARPSVPSTKAFLNLVARGFSARRKMVRNCLKPLYLPEQVVAALEACGLSPETRAQDLTVDQFAHLHWALHEQTTGKELGEEQSAALAAAEAAASEADLMMREGAAD